MQQAQGHPADRAALAGMGWGEGHRGCCPCFSCHSLGSSSVRQDSNGRDQAGQAWSPAPRTFLQLNERKVLMVTLAGRGGGGGGGGR